MEKREEKSEGRFRLREQFYKELSLRRDLYLHGLYIKKCKWVGFEAIKKGGVPSIDGYKLYSCGYGAENDAMFPPDGFYPSLEELEIVLKDIYDIDFFEAMYSVEDD